MAGHIPGARNRFFRDNLGAFPYTHLAVPALVGGQVYANDEPLSAFVPRAMGVLRLIQERFMAVETSSEDDCVPVRSRPEGNHTNATGFLRFQGSQTWGYLCRQQNTGGSQPPLPVRTLRRMTPRETPQAPTDALTVEVDQKTYFGRTGSSS